MPKFHLLGNFENINQYRKDQQYRQEEDRVVHPCGRISLPPADLLLAIAVLALVIGAGGTPINTQDNNSGSTLGQPFSLVTNSSSCDYQKAETGIYSLLRSLMDADSRNNLNDEQTIPQSRKKKNNTKNEISELHNDLYNAILNNDVPYVKELIMYGLNVDEAITVKSKQFHLLHLSIAKDHYEMVETLLLAGADPNKISNGVHPLTIATCNAYFKVPELLVTYGASFTTQDPNAAITLKNSRHYVAARNNRQYFYYPLHLAMLYEPWNVAKIIDLGADLNQKDFEGLAPMHYAARYSPTNIPLLVSRGADVNATPPSTLFTPLHSAVLHEPRSIIPLITNGANINALTADGHYSPLMLATIYNPNSLAILLDYNQHLDAQNFYGDAAIHLAIKYQQEIALNLLVVKGANINIPNSLGQTALHVAIEFWMKKVNFLMSHGANPHLRNNAGKSALDLMAGLDLKYQNEDINSKKKSPKSLEKKSDTNDKLQSNKFINPIYPFIAAIVGIFLLYGLIKFFTRKKTEQKLEIAHNPNRSHGEARKKSAHEIRLELLKNKIKDLEVSVADIEKTVTALATKKIKLFSEFNKHKKEVAKIYRKIISSKLHESDEKFIKKHAANIINSFRKVVLDHLNLASNNHFEFLRSANEIKDDYNNLIAKFDSLSVISDENLLTFIGNLIVKLSEKITNLQTQQANKNRTYLTYENNLNIYVDNINTDDKAISIALGKREKTSGYKKEKEPILDTIDQPLLLVAEPQVATPEHIPAPIEEIAVSKPAAPKKLSSLPPQVLDDRHTRESGELVHPAKPAKDFVLPEQQLIGTLKLAQSHKQRLSRHQSSIPPSPKLFENIYNHIEDLNELLKETQNAALKPEEIDTAIYRYSCSFSLFQTMHNIWLLVLNLKTRGNLSPQVMLKISELYKVIKDFRHMLGHLPDNFELNTLLITAKQCASLLPLIATLNTINKAENNDTKGIKEDDITTLINGIKQTDLYQHLSHPWAHRKHQYPDDECLLKIGNALHLIPSIAKVFSTLSAFQARSRIAVNRKHAISMLMLIAGEYIKHLDRKIRAKISKTLCYIEVNKRLFENLISYRKLVAHLPEEEFKIEISNLADIDQQVFNFAITLTSSDRLASLIKLLLEDADTLLRETKKNLLPPLPVLVPPPTPIKLNSKAAPFTPMQTVAKKPAAAELPNDNRSVVMEESKSEHRVSLN